ncbi:MAG: hypothetical protein E2598_07290 [Sphingobium sp.]|nr:hypothetical protein [Sphingobium sp.]
MKAPLFALLMSAPVMGVFALNAPIALAQDRVTIGDVIVGSILSDMAHDRQAVRDARQWPYMSNEKGSIASAAEAQSVCSDEIVAEAGNGAAIIGTPSTRTMATGWEVEGQISIPGDEARSFACSVRNGLVSGTLIRR